MKRKFFITLFLVLTLISIFAISVSATVIYETASGQEIFRYEVYQNTAEVRAEKGFTNSIISDFVGTIKSYEGQFPKIDMYGNAVTWYVKETNEDAYGNTIKTVACFITTDPEWCTISSNGNYQFNTEKGVNFRNVVSVNFPNDENIRLIQNGTSYYGLHANQGDFSPKRSELLFAYFPNTYTYNFSDRLVQATPVLAVEFDEEIVNLYQLPNTAFYDCRNLRSIRIPSCVETISEDGNGAFFRCANLETVDFFDGWRLSYIGNRTFSNCYSLKEVIFPNSVSYIGQRVFERCFDLKKVSFGDGVSTLDAQSLMYGAGSLQYIYISNAIVDSYAEINVGTHSFTDTTPSWTGYGKYEKSVIFFAGTMSEALDFKALIGTNNQGKVNHDNYIEWDPTKSDEYYVQMAENEGKNYVIYGYSKCQAFYNDEHQMYSTSYDFEGDKYVTGFCEYTKCEMCPQVSVTKLISPIFTSLGYSIEEGAYSISLSIKLDHSALYEYMALTGNELEYGLLANVAYPSDYPINSDGTATNDQTIFVEMSNTVYVFFAIKVTGLRYDKKINCCAYVIEDDDVTYINGQTASSKAKWISCDILLNN